VRGKKEPAATVRWISVFVRLLAKYEKIVATWTEPGRYFDAHASMPREQRLEIINHFRFRVSWWIRRDRHELARQLGDVDTSRHENSLTTCA